nr:hypothetical protein [Pseudoalteromonas sp. OOF1S-7]
MQLIPLWYANLSWAKELIARSFGLETASEILKQENRGRRQVPGTNWFIKTHGVGVDIFKSPEVGGIDFDFGHDAPDAWRLKYFFEKQFNDGQLPAADYIHLADDEERLKAAIKVVLSSDKT